MTKIVCRALITLSFAFFILPRAHAFQLCSTSCPSNPSVCDNTCFMPTGVLGQFAETTCGIWIESRSVYTFSEPTMEICHLDPDQHLLEVVVEFYTADEYKSVGICDPLYKYSKYKIAEVSCSIWTGLTSPSTCRSRVENKVAQLAAQGFVPNFGDGDHDYCPLPRL